MSTPIQRLKKCREILGADTPTFARFVSEDPKEVAKAIMGYNAVKPGMDRKVIDKLII